jgi:hypothetical protein
MSITEIVDLVGAAAAVLTLVAFAQKRMLPMRIAAIAANLVFIAYGLAGGYAPVLVLHLVLLPLNLVRLAGELARRRRAVGEPGLMGWV